MGHDYALAMPALLDGLFWFKNNGLAAPWFTPSFCAGQPFFADPQSSYYSLVHALAFFTNPVNASYLTLLAMSCTAFWGGYLLMRQVFGAGQAASVLTGGLLMFNEFLPTRIVIGHLGFHGFSLLCWLALFLLIPLRRRIDAVAASIGACLVLTYWVHSGMGTLIVPASIGVLLIAILNSFRDKVLGRFVLRSALAIPLALALSAAKLNAAVSLLGNFPRNFYLLPGIDSLFDAFMVIVASLFVPAEYTYVFASGRLVNLQWALQPHEWAFGFTPVVAALALLFIAVVTVKKKWGATGGFANLGKFVLLFLLLAWPIAFNTYEPTWNEFLKSIPILGNASTPTRWAIVYIPFVAVVMGALLQRIEWREQSQWLIVISTLSVVVMLSALEPRGFLLSQSYDVRPVVAADKAFREGKLTPGIRELGVGINMRTNTFEKNLKSNDTLIAGISQIFCYNPIFGYRLEKFDATNLAEGNVLSERQGFLNLKNPACYVFPKENNCNPGDLFRADQLEEAKRFIAYQPFRFAMSKQQVLANTITELILIGIAVFLVGWLFARFRPSFLTDSKGTR